ncbi:H+/Cl-antiporter ClcA [Chitinophaga jiangningensis]|uniref:H+/Cl-antiporter ClcA n=1 Tax=Chitinophaga jiangningensis TaxID=1419482 RepID=A0A1M6WVC7_9BACT|nr:chloride channel protein [Chitinophaga jiangningensis]SHK97722.1 H+/Cl-antiporter ClcA [Chitinophaga jiangningensis]
MSHKNRKQAVFIAPSLDKSAYDLKKTSENAVSGRLFYVCVQVVINAVIIGFIAKGLVALISLITNLSFYGKFSFAESSPAHNQLGLWVIVIPVIGAVIIGIMARLGSAAIRGHGIPEAMEQVLTNESKIKPVITILKPLSAAISIGTGGPFGAEGPIISTGGAFGSFAGQIMRISPNERKIMLTAGATSGMAAIFGTPVAAVLLAIELLLFEFSPKTIIPVALACATGTAMHIAMFGSGPVFPMAELAAPTPEALAWYIGIGAVIGVLAAIVSKSIYLIEDLFEKLPMHWMWWPAIGAVAIGVVGYFAPYTLGVGYNNITELLSGNLPLQMVLGLCFLKFISWSISLGSGTSGGTLAPLLTIGGATGVLIGMAVMHFVPNTQINLPTCALIGMAAMFAGAARALLTAVIFAFEVTMQPHGLLPLLGACTASYFVSFFLMKGTIMTEKIQRRGVATPDAYEPDILQRLKAADVMASARQEEDAKDTEIYVYPDTPLHIAVALMSEYKLTSLPVLNTADNTLTGIITPALVFDAYTNFRQTGNQHQQVISVKRRRNKLLVRGRHLFNRQ